MAQWSSEYSCCISRGLVGQDTFGQYLALYGESQDGDTVGSVNGLVG